MNGRLAAYNITAADTPTSIYRCRTDGYGMATVSLVNRSLSTAQLTISIHADSEDTEGDILEYKTDLLPKNVLERSAMTIPSGSYLTIESDVVGISAVVWGTEVGTLDAALDDVSEAPIAWSQTFGLDNPNAYGTGTTDQMGDENIAIGNNYMIIGARLEDDAGGDSSGKAYVFNTTSGTLTYTLDNPNASGTTAGDEFGFAVAVSDNYFVVSASREDDANGADQGTVYVFDASTGNLARTIANPNSSYQNGDRFGQKLAMDGDTVLVGAPFTGNYDGRAYLIDASTGSTLHTLNNPNQFGEGGSDDQFGIDVAIQGGLCIVGAFHEDVVSDTRSGVAYIFNVGSGILAHTLVNPDADGNPGNDRFGNSVAIHGSYAAVGATGADDAATNKGMVYIYNTSTGALIHSLSSPDGEAIGHFHSLAMDAEYVYIAAYYATVGGYTSQGKVYVFRISTGTLVHTIDNPDPDTAAVNGSTYFGYAIAANNTRIAIAEPRRSVGSFDNSGKAYIYDLD